MSNCEKYKVDVPVGTRGNWHIERFVISQRDEDLQRLRAAINPHRPARVAPAGLYTRLRWKGNIVMSDTPDEIRDILYAVGKAKGKCLINGLGLGVALQAFLEKPEVSHVTVVEIDQDVIDLVGPHYLTKYGIDRLTIVHADAFEYKPKLGTKFDVVWHDIWSEICEDNLKDMHKLHRRYGRRASWQGSWCRAYCELRRY